MITIICLRASALIAAIAGIASAQTPAGFTPAAVNNQTLGVTYGTNSVMPAGELIPRPETADPPTITTILRPANASRAILFMIDQDVLRNNSRTTLLHWFAPNIPLVFSSNGTLAIPAVTNATGGAPYLQPSPPVGDIPHEYVFLLFTQPANFAIPAGFDISPPPSTNDRIGFNVTDFAIQARLSAPIAAIWMTVQNTTGVASTTSSSVVAAATTGTATRSATGSTVATGTAVAPYTGAGNVNAGAVGGIALAGLAGLAGVML